MASVEVSPSVVTLQVAESQQLTATAKDDAGNELSGREITWETSNDAIASISGSGLVEGIAEGSATITATSEGVSGTAEVSVVSAVAFTAVITGGAHSCALDEDGAAYCWGRGESGQLGSAPTDDCPDLGLPCSMVPVAVDGGLTFTQLAGGGAHTCGLTDDGSAYCWGRNTDGQLGDDSQTDRDAPVPVETAVKFASIDLGGSHTCGLTVDGAAYCWGLNSRGQLGDGTTTRRLVPVPVGGDQVFQLIVAGGFEDAHGQTCALVETGDAYCWGDNERGQLGIGTNDLSSHPDPTLVSTPEAFTDLTTGLGRHTCGLIADGDAFCWGENTFGALGNGSADDSSEPDAVSGGIAFAHIVAGGFIGHTCGWTDSGTAYCWGENERGQVGDGSTFDRLEPSPVAGDLMFDRLDAGFRHTCGRALDGALYCWGSNAAAQLGIGSTIHSSEPVPVSAP